MERTFIEETYPNVPSPINEDVTASCDTPVALFRIFVTVDWRESEDMYPNVPSPMIVDVTTACEAPPVLESKKETEDTS